MKKVAFFLILSLVVLQFCVSTKKSTTTAAGKPAHVAVTYLANVQPTIANNCSPCHMPPKGFKKALNSYEAANANIDDMITRIKLNPGERGFMPFKHNKLSDSLIAIFTQWKADGLLEK